MLRHSIRAGGLGYLYVANPCDGGNVLAYALRSRKWVNEIDNGIAFPEALAFGP